MHTARTNHLILFALAFLSACSHGGSVVPFTTHKSGAPAPTWTKTFSYGAKLLVDAQPIAPANVKNYSIMVALQLRDEPGLLRYAQDVSNPGSAVYRHFLTPNDIADRFGASQSDHNAVISYFQRFGLQTAGWKQREAIMVSGPTAAMEQALGTTIGTFTKLGQTFYGPLTTPHLQQALPVESVSGLVTFETLAHNLFNGTPSGGNALLGVGYSPFQLSAAFDYTGAYNAGYTGKGITIGIIGSGPISPADVPAYKSLFNVPGSSTVTQVAVQGAGFATPPPVTGPCQGATPLCYPEDSEAQLDTEQTASLAVDSNILFYTAYKPSNPTQNGNTLVYVYSELQQAINDNLADVLSLSFGTSEQNALKLGDITQGGGGPGPAAFASAVSEGMAIFVSSGDAGAETCQPPTGPTKYIDSLCTTYPAEDPSNVAVGGTTSPIGTNGRFIGPVTAWGQQTLGQNPTGPAGSGGGISSVFPLPAYQQGVPGIQGSMRNFPDVSLNADLNTGDALLVYADPNYFAEQVSPVGGTSASAPDAAAMWALVLQACSAKASCTGAAGPHPYRFGNPNARLYAIYKSSAYSSTFFDVVFGSNAMPNTCVYSQTCPQPNYDAGYTAGRGYDNVTGLGVPFARSLIKAIVGV